MSRCEGPLINRGMAVVAMLKKADRDAVTLGELLGMHPQEIRRTFRAMEDEGLAERLPPSSTVRAPGRRGPPPVIWRWVQ